MQDVEIEKLIQLETNRQATGLEMIPSENHTSGDVLKALGSRLTDKYSEGYPGSRYYGGCEFVDQVENIARRGAHLEQLWRGLENFIHGAGDKFEQLGDVGSKYSSMEDAFAAATRAAKPTCAK